MTVDGTNNRTDYDPDGATSTFIYDFRVDVASDMVVYAEGVLYVEPFTITGLGNETGGDVIFDVAPLGSIEVLTLIREVPLTQQTAYPPLGPFPAESHEAALDKLTFIAQQQQEELSRAALAGVDADPVTDYTLPPYSPGEVWLWDTATQAIITAGIATPVEVAVDSIALLRSLDPDAYSEGTPITPTGYFNSGDGGGGPGHVLIKSGGPYTDNGIDIIVAGGAGIGSEGDSAWVWAYSGEVNVKWGGAVGDGIITGGVINAGATDDTAALQALVNRSTEAPWALYTSPGVYLTTEELTVPEDDRPGRAFGINMHGDNTNWNDISVIYAKHNGPSILSLKGSNGSHIWGLKLVSDPVTYPKTGMVLGRDVNVDSCGWHNIHNMWIAGNFPVAGIYSIASEENIWDDIFIYLTGGGAKYGFYTCVSDALGVDSLPTSSNIANSITKMNVWNVQAISDSACIYIEGAQACGSWSFKDCYCIPKSGSYYQINNGAIDGLSCLGTFTFDNCGGEIYAPINPWLDTPTEGYRISSVANLDMIGLSIIGARCQLINAASTRKVLNVDDNLILIHPNIIIPPVEDPTISYKMISNKIKGGIFNVANSGDWTGLAFNAPWANNFGVPYAQAAFRVSPDGILSLRGVVNNGSTGLSIIAQLPPGFEPGKILVFPTLDVLTNAIVQVSELGAISLTTGTGAQVNLNGISFKLVD